MASILLAEDDSSMRKFIETTLIKAGHTVEACEDGTSAFAKINETKQNESYDLLLTDIVMPGMDGIELSQKASDKYPDMKVIFITGFAAVTMGTNRANGKVKENTRVLSKPFHLKQLVTQINEVLAA